MTLAIVKGDIFLFLLRLYVALMLQAFNHPWALTGTDPCRPIALTSFKPSANIRLPLLASEPSETATIATRALVDRRQCTCIGELSLSKISLAYYSRQHVHLLLQPRSHAHSWLLQAPENPQSHSCLLGVLGPGHLMIQACATLIRREYGRTHVWGGGECGHE
jgi:hypothetical protein